MHSWVVIPETQEIIDMSTGSLPENCMAMTGMDWPGDKPPQYLWANTQELIDNKQGPIYLPVLDATKFLIASLCMMLKTGIVDQDDTRAIRKDIEETFL